MLIAEFWARWLGIELNERKREPPRSSTRHLGFCIDLHKQVVSITKKQKSKILGYFDQFLISVRKNGRVKIKSLQRMLGLQIWISTVFRIARQFLTSICDALRQSHKTPGKQERFFFPRKNRHLASRIIFDLKFWRRFLLSSPHSTFKSLLGLLPQNRDCLFSDASSTFGMAGVLLFDPLRVRHQEAKGLF